MLTFIYILFSLHLLSNELFLNSPVVEKQSMYTSKKKKCKPYAIHTLFGALARGELRLIIMRNITKNKNFALIYYNP